MNRYHLLPEQQLSASQLSAPTLPDSATANPGQPFNFSWLEQADNDEGYDFDVRTMTLALELNLRCEG